MRRGAYYNEHDPFAAAWLRNLISAGHIAPGDVDEGDIRDIRPDDLKGYTQCHFFAGIGVWSYALRRAGWADDRPIWTGSCPCQPFSSAGRGDGFADERHLWPHWFWLIGECRPAIVVGEQVASKDGLGWLDLVQADLEGANYAVGASDLCAAGFSGAHIRQRLYFSGMDRLADTEDCYRRSGERRAQAGARPETERRRGFAGSSAADRLVDVQQQQGLEGYTGDGSRGGEPRRIQPDTPGSTAAAGGSGGLDHSSSARCVGSVEEPEGNSRNEARLRVSGDGCSDGRLADADSRERQWITDGEGRECDGSQAGWQQSDSQSSTSRTTCGLADAECFGREVAVLNHGSSGAPNANRQASQPRVCQPINGTATHAPLLGRNPVDWLWCRDGKWRPVEPGTFPLADAAPARVGRLRAYGNALDAETAAQFIGAVKAIDDYLSVV